MINDAACSYVGDLLRCLLADVKLRQHGATKELDVDQGTLYVNDTDGLLHLPLSTTGVQPHGVVMSYHTVRGTFVSLPPGGYSTPLGIVVAGTAGENGIGVPPDGGE